MGRKKKTQTGNQKQLDLLETLGDFTSKENWDKFFTIRGGDDSFEWYAEWNQLKDPLLSLLRSSLSSSSATGDPGRQSLTKELQILVPGCGNSRLSEHLYDAGFHAITNVDFSKVVISDMLRRNVRDRSVMRWRVMDITEMQFMDEIFDVVLDKGGLDALMEPELGSRLGNRYLSEVKRVSKTGGKFICLTLAESHVIGLLFSKFRFGWKMVIHSIPQTASRQPGLTTYIIVAEKDNLSSLHQIVLSFDHSLISSAADQAKGLLDALDAENRIRLAYSDGSDVLYSLEELKLGVEGDLMELRPGRRVQLTLGGVGDSSYRYKAVLLDAKQEYGPFLYHCGVFLVQKTRSHEWLFSSEEGQWVVVESSKAARLIMILLDSSHLNLNMDEIQKDLSPLVKQLAPGNHDDGSQIPFMMAGDGIKERKVIQEASSKLTGAMVVEDVVYESTDKDSSNLSAADELVFRRLVFRRTEGLVQSEALLIEDANYLPTGVETEVKTPCLISKSKKKEKQKGISSKLSMSNGFSDHMKVDHSFLASSYHTGIVAGFSLISSYMETSASSGRMVEVVVIGLGAGLLPKFLHDCIPFIQVEAVELDPVVASLAKDHFGFDEDDRLKVHVADGIQYIRDLSMAKKQIDIVIIDVDASDPSSGLSCPAKDFVDHPFLTTVKSVLSEQGLFVVNLVSRSTGIKNTVISRMKSVFSRLYCLQLEEDVNEVVFALNSSASSVKVEDDKLSDAAAATELDKLLKLERLDRIQGILDSANNIKCLK